jgi:multicomponent Na+:H+ antiporter subunit C
LPNVLHTLPYFVAAWLFFCGLYGLVTSRHLIHSVVCLAILQSSTYVLLLGIGYRAGGVAPISVGIPPGTSTVDPVVQALMLTDVVVKAHEKAGTVSPDELRTLRG